MTRPADRGIRRSRNVDPDVDIDPRFHLASFAHTSLRTRPTAACRRRAVWDTAGAPNAGSERCSPRSSRRLVGRDFRYGQFRNEPVASLVGRAVSTRSAEIAPYRSPTNVANAERSASGLLVLWLGVNGLCSRAEPTSRAGCCGHRSSNHSNGTHSRQQNCPPIVTGPTHIGPRPSLPAMPSTQPPTTTRRRTTASGPSRTAKWECSVYPHRPQGLFVSGGAAGGRCRGGCRADGARRRAVRVG